MTQLPPRREKSASSVAKGKCPATEEIATSEGGAGGDAARDPVTVSFAGGVNEKKSTMPSSRPSTRVFGPCFDHRATRMRRRRRGQLRSCSRWVGPRHRGLEAKGRREGNRYPVVVDACGEDGGFVRASERVSPDSGDALIAWRTRDVGLNAETGAAARKSTCEPSARNARKRGVSAAALLRDPSRAFAGGVRQKHCRAKDLRLFIRPGR